MRCLKDAVFGCNISFNRAIGTSPFLARYGRQQNLKTEESLGISNEKRETLQLIHDRIAEAAKKYVSAEIREGDVVERTINVGSKVLVYNYTPSSPLDRR